MPVAATRAAVLHQPTSSLAESWARLISAFRPEVQLSNDARIATAPAVELGLRLLEAADRDDLQDRLDDLALEPSLGWALAGLLRALEDLDAPTRADVADAVAPFEEVLGHGQHDVLVRADRLVQTLGKLQAVFDQMLRAMGIAPPPLFTVLEADFSAAEVIDDARMPPEFRLAALSNFRMIAVLFGLVALKLRGPHPEPWLRRALAEILAAAAERTVAFFAGVTRAELPEDLLPPRARLDLPAIVSRHAIANEAFWQLSKQAATEDVDVFPTHALDD